MLFGVPFYNRNSNSQSPRPIGLLILNNVLTGNLFNGYGHEAIGGNIMHLIKPVFILVPIVSCICILLYQLVEINLSTSLGTSVLVSLTEAV